MAESSTPASAINHEPPSLPNSPEPKRTRLIDESASVTVARALLFDSGAGTPTPTTMATDASSSAPATTPAATLEVKFLSDKARAPTKGSTFAAGHDLYSARTLTIPARGRARVDTDIAISVPAGTYGRVAPRSGLAAKHGIDTLAGVIDADYRGQVGVILANLSDEDFVINEGDRIAQLIIEKIVTPEVVVVETLSETVRGAGGFGSTGGFGAPKEV